MTMEEYALKNNYQKVVGKNGFTYWEHIPQQNANAQPFYVYTSAAPTYQGNEKKKKHPIIRFFLSAFIIVFGGIFLLLSVSFVSRFALYLLYKHVMESEWMTTTDDAWQDTSTDEYIIPNVEEQIAANNEHIYEIETNASERFFNSIRERYSEPYTSEEVAEEVFVEEVAPESTIEPEVETIPLDEPSPETEVVDMVEEEPVEVVE